MGTRSILFGAHQFLWHPICVARAWKLLYQRWPTCWEWVAIFCHDLGYWGLPNMDGKEGKNHPKKGAALAEQLYLRFHPGHDAEAFQLYEFTVGHSVSYSRQFDYQISPLFYADKVSTLMEPPWFYLLRVWLTGEWREYEADSPMKGKGLTAWFKWYRLHLANKHFGALDKQRFHQTPKFWKL